MSEKISVLIPMFNREKFINDSLKNILNQTHSNLDIIIYDDGSTDKSISIIKKLQKEDSRIRLIEGKVNKGVGYARNILIKNCTTKYACWHDSDDISNINRIAIQYNIIKESNAIVFCKWKWLKFYTGSWKLYAGTTHQAFATLLFPVDKEIKFKSKLYLGGEDWDWIKRMKLKYSEQLAKHYLYYVRFHNDRIGIWKRKIRATVPRNIIQKLTYKEVIEYYRKNYGK